MKFNVNWPPFVGSRFRWPEIRRGGGRNWGEVCWGCHGWTIISSVNPVVGGLGTVGGVSDVGGLLVAGTGGFAGTGSAECQADPSWIMPGTEHA